MSVFFESNEPCWLQQMAAILIGEEQGASDGYALMPIQTSLPERVFPQRYK